jgi:hypothetical protein
MISADHRRTVLIACLPLLAIAQVVAGSFSSLTGLGVSIPERSAANDTLAVPATYAFAIWGVIFLWSLVFAIYQALPAQRDNALVARLRAPAAAAWALNTVWEINAQLNGLGWSSTLIILGLVGAALTCMWRAESHSGAVAARDRWLAAAPLYALAGWGTIATFGQISTTMDVAGVAEAGMPAVVRDAALILSAGALGFAVTRRTRHPAVYALAAAWGLTAVFVKGLQGASPITVTAAAVGVVTILVAWGTGDRARRLRLPGSAAGQPS